jgi:signal peptidase II
LKKILSSYGLLVLVAGVIILLDQVTKAFVRATIPFGGSIIPLEGLPFLRIVHWENTGAAFGMFQGGGVIFGILAVIVSVIIVVYFPKIPADYFFMRFALAMQLGGALGNLIDRIRFGPVTDFIAVGAFPVFNIADASITIGVAILLLFLWILERKEKAGLLDSDAPQPDQPDTSPDSQT